MADGKPNDVEVRFLDLWLRDHKAVASAWPGRVPAKRLGEVFAVGVITQDELKYFKRTLGN